MTYNQQSSQTFKAQQHFLSSYLSACVVWAFLLFSYFLPATLHAESSAGVNQTNLNQSVEKKLRIVTTFTIIQDIAAQVAGDRAIVESIIKPGAEIHDYQPTPQDISKVQHADLVLYNGLHLEQWFEKFFNDIPNVPAVIVTEGLKPLPIVESGMFDKKNQQDIEQHTDHHAINPHAWMSPANAIIYVENIRSALVKYDPVNAEYYSKNAKDYTQKLQSLIDQTRLKLSHIPAEKRWLVTSEGAFGYLAKEFDLNEAFLFAINSEQQTSPQQIKNLIDLINQHKIPVIFSESTLSPKPAMKIAEETTAKYGGVLYVDSLSPEGGPVPHFYDLLSLTLQRIYEGFE